MHTKALVVCVAAALAGGAAGQCDYAADTCKYRGDGECDVGGANVDCANGTDCFDCEPCRKHGSCGACTDAGCLWCEKEQMCASAAVPQTYWRAAVFPKQQSCQASDFRASACPAPDAGNVFSDPAYPAMAWVYAMVKVEPVWNQGVRGGGVLVQVNDDGVDTAHPDFAGKFDQSQSCQVSKPQGDGVHGTVCAAIALGNNNSECSVGIAPSARLAACTILKVDPYPELEDDAYLYKPGTRVDVSSNSWGVDTCTPKTDRRAGRVLQSCPFSPLVAGPCSLPVCSSWAPPSEECLEAVKEYCSGAGYEREPLACAEYLDLLLDGCKYAGLSDRARELLARGVTDGRDGKGIVYVFAAGNGYQSAQDVNFEGWQNTRFTISVGAVGKQGRHASYSTVGAAVFISAPGGDAEFVTNFVVAHPSGACRDAGFGTSYAAPVVSGVVALLLEVNPALTWRDVQGVLASTAVVTDPTDASWFTNAALVKHSYKYGFGVVNAEAAVAAARTWTPWQPERQVTVSKANVNLPIPDDKSVVSSAAEVTSAEWGTKKVESVSVYLDLSHGSRGDLKITLISPQGTPSVLTPGKRPEAEQVQEHLKLTTLRSWGENAAGTWTLTVSDVKAGGSCVSDEVFSVTRDVLTATCQTFRETEWCKDGAVTDKWVTGLGTVANFTDARGRSPLDACCVCGGGNSPASVLRGWRMVVYGRVSAATPTPVTTPTPNDCETCPALSGSAACAACGNCLYDALNVACNARVTPAPVTTGGAAGENDCGSWCWLFSWEWAW